MGRSKAEKNKDTDLNYNVNKLDLIDKYRFFSFKREQTVFKLTHGTEIKISLKFFKFDEKDKLRDSRMYNSFKKTTLRHLKVRLVNKVTIKR